MNMLMKILMAFSFMLAFSVACDPCICNKWAGTLSCSGPEADVFPNVTGEGISHIDILNTSLLNWLIRQDLQTYLL